VNKSIILRYKLNITGRVYNVRYKTNKRTVKKDSRIYSKSYEENLVNQINTMVDKLEDLLKVVKNISEDNIDISKKAGRILSNTQWTIANLNIDTIITNVSEYDMAKARLNMIKQYEEAL